MPTQWGQDAVAWKVNILIVFAPYRKGCNSINVTSTPSPLGWRWIRTHKCITVGKVPLCEFAHRKWFLRTPSQMKHAELFLSVCCGDCVVEIVLMCCMRCPLQTPPRPSAPWWWRRGAAHHLSLSLAPSKMSQWVPGVPTHTKEAARKLFHIFCQEICCLASEVNYAVIRVNVTVFPGVFTGDLAKCNQWKLNDYRD